MLNRDSDVSHIIFAAGVEGGDTQTLEHTMECFTRATQNLRIIYLSSDGVFDGQKGNYSENDVPNPITVYGRNVLLCEHMIRENCPNHCIIRPSYIYGFSDGALDKRLAETREKLLNNSEVPLFSDMYKSPLGVGTVAEAIAWLTFSEYGGVLHVGGERLSVYDFHERGMKALGVNTEKLKSQPVPPNAGIPPDTSLDSSLWQKLTGMSPASIEETLG